MAVLLDPPRWPAHGRLWSHLASDVSYAELHAFGARAGVPARAFEGDHYDVPQERYDELVAAGARPVATRELLLALQRSGLRRPKRKGERVLGSAPVRTAQGDLVRVDVLASRLTVPGGRPDDVRALVLAGDRLLVLPGAAAGVPGGALGPAELTAAAASRHVADQAGLAVPTSSWQLVGHLRSTAVGEDLGPAPPVGGLGWASVVLARVQAAHALGTGRWVDADHDRAALAHQQWWPLALGALGS